ncbi:MAG: D-glycero-beta-D-manno-heptose-7-phosphate kinase [Elusimicrobiota bacterium]|jgi:D-beta-D-heptose 7-phosphate kinase/D-beta-D-heptose 1-phosphate adenosyltransferase|nr:D-glycero-beta-D-manno-heptose-7-phosphate kinase [Elusimicrobiota bacterium]
MPNQNDKHFKRFYKILNSFENKQIIVIGDVMLDHSIKGGVSRISPEAPVPIVNVENEIYAAGGAGNVAVNLAALGAKPIILSLIGEDIKGQVLKDYLAKKGVDVSKLVKDKERPTTQKIRIIAERQQVVRIDRESRSKIPPDIAKVCIQNFKAALKNAKGVVMSDYGKGMLSDHNIHEIIKLCRAKKIPVCVDPKIDNFKKYKYITCMTPNTKEAWEGMGLPPQKDEAALIALGKNILKTLRADSILITRSAEGMTLFEKAPKIKIATIKAAAQEVFDVTGAGDTVISVLTLALACKASLKDAAYIANKAAGVVVSKLGTATVTREEIKEVLK